MLEDLVRIWRSSSLKADAAGMFIIGDIMPPPCIIAAAAVLPGIMAGEAIGGLYTGGGTAAYQVYYDSTASGGGGRVRNPDEGETRGAGR